MHIIARLFGRSPFSPLKKHMGYVSDSLEKLTEIVMARPSLSPIEMEKKIEQLYQLHREADLKKRESLGRFPKNLFTPVERGDFFDILSLQDLLVSQAENIGVILSFQMLPFSLSFQLDLESLLQKNLETFLQSRKIIQEIEELLEASFGGMEGKRVQAIIERTLQQEQEAKIFLRGLMKRYFMEEQISVDFYLKIKIFESVGTISALSGKLATHILMLLEP